MELIYTEFIFNFTNLNSFSRFFSTVPDWCLKRLQHIELSWFINPSPIELPAIRSDDMEQWILFCERMARLTRLKTLGISIYGCVGPNENELFKHLLPVKVKNRFNIEVDWNISKDIAWQGEAPFIIEEVFLGCLCPPQTLLPSNKLLPADN